MKFLDILQYAGIFPVPALLIAFGVVFVGIAIVGKVEGKINLSSGPRATLALVGMFLFVLGFTAYSMAQQGSSGLTASGNPEQVSSIAALAAKGPASTDAIAGKWTGTFYGEGSTFSTQIDLSIEANCAPGNMCGTYSASALACSGSLVFKSASGDTYDFIEQTQSPHEPCFSGGHEYMRLVSPGTLNWRYEGVSASGSKLISSGVLKNR